MASDSVLHVVHAEVCIFIVAREGHHMSTSAPVNMLDWSKIPRVDSVESLQGMDDDELEMVSPHEYLEDSLQLPNPALLRCYNKREAWFGLEWLSTLRPTFLTLQGKRLSHEITRWVALLQGREE